MNIVSGYEERSLFRKAYLKVQSRGQVAYFTVRLG